jgi:hypothetical protein
MDLNVKSDLKQDLKRLCGMHNGGRDEAKDKRMFDSRSG